MDFLIKKFTDVNQIFQSEQMVLPKENFSMVSLLKEILKMYMVDEYIDSYSDNNFSNIDPTNAKQYRPLKQMLLPQESWDFLDHCEENQLLTHDEIDSALKNCRIIMLEVCKKLKEKFDYEQEWIKVLKFFHPENAVSETFHAENPTLNDVFDCFHFTSNYTANQRNEINEMWAILPTLDFPASILEVKRADHFWIKLQKCTFEQMPAFKNLAQFIIDILLISPSNAAIERRWSTLNHFKDNTKNSLSSETITALMKAYSYINGK